jgi:hypothetical protein
MARPIDKKQRKRLVLLAIIAGPMGLFFTSPRGALFMAIAAAASGWTGAEGVLICVNFVCGYWAWVAIAQYNAKIESDARSDTLVPTAIPRVSQ